MNNRLSSPVRKARLFLPVGIAFMASAPVLYFVYHLTGSNFSPYWWLPPLGVALFLSGFYVARASGSRPHLFRRLELPAKLIAAGTILIWLFYFESSLVTVTVDSSFAGALAWVAALAGTDILNLMGVGAHLAGTVIVFPAGSKLGGIAVENACSGIQASTAFLAAYVFVLIDLGGKISSKKKLLALVALGPAMIYGMNILRIVALSLIGYFFGYSPLSIAHDYLDFAVFIAEVSVFWLLSLRWARGGRKEEGDARNNADLTQGKASPRFDFPGTLDTQ